MGARKVHGECVIREGVDKGIEKRDDEEREKSSERWKKKEDVKSFFHMVTPDTGTVLLYRFLL